MSGHRVTFISWEITDGSALNNRLALFISVKIYWICCERISAKLRGKISIEPIVSCLPFSKALTPITSLPTGAKFQMPQSNERQHSYTIKKFQINQSKMAYYDCLNIPLVRGLQDICLQCLYSEWQGQPWRPDGIVVPWYRLHFKRNTWAVVLEIDSRGKSKSGDAGEISGLGLRGSSGRDLITVVSWKQNFGFRWVAVKEVPGCLQVFDLSKWKIQLPLDVIAHPDSWIDHLLRKRRWREVHEQTTLSMPQPFYKRWYWASGWK